MNEAPSRPPRAKDRGRKTRLAEALRENLKRRKAQLRERDAARPTMLKAEGPGDDEPKPT